MESQSLKGKVAAVTGASSGFGQVIAETLGKAGAHVFMCGRSTEAMEASKADIEAAGGGATLAAFDMRDVASVDAFVSQAAAHAGRLDILVNNAGLGHQGAIADGDPEQWREMFEVNVIGLLVGCKAAIREMRETKSHGRIINISSTAALSRESGVYGATKHAVNCITTSLRDELDEDDIRVTSLMPGVFATNFVRNFDTTFIKGMLDMLGMGDVEAGPDGKFPREAMAQLQEKMAAVAGNPQEVADAVLYLVNQPTSTNIQELVIRPPKNMELPG
jgi:NADP-dependent 3-hydroxy acid dehydrogenase YdfG